VLDGAGEDELIARIARHLRQPVRTDLGVDQRVMAAVESLPRHRPAGALGTAVRWLTRRRTLALSPLGGLALAAGIAALGFVAAPRVLRRPPSEESVRATPASSQSVVQFVLFAPAAKSVALVGDFNDWDPGATPLLTAQPGGAWSVAIPLAPGRHRYAFVVDGTQWLADPGAPPSRDDDFGSPNSIVTVGA
jgi:predicted carbohydrate-binding protein with CBM48